MYHHICLGAFSFFHILQVDNLCFRPLNSEMKKMHIKPQKKKEKQIHLVIGFLVIMGIIDEESIPYIYKNHPLLVFFSGS